MSQITVFDLAEYIVGKLGPMSAMKLQKLVYYGQAWSLVWTERALFKNDIQAWANGPVVPALYQRHRGHFVVRREFFGGDKSKLSSDQRDVVDRVLKFYGDKDPQWLSSLTHMEAPWREARKGVLPGERGTEIISKESMLEYYQSL